MCSMRSGNRDWSTCIVTWISTKYMHANVSIGNSTLAFYRTWHFFQTAMSPLVCRRSKRDLRENATRVFLWNLNPFEDTLLLVAENSRNSRSSSKTLYHPLFSRYHTFKYWMWILLNIWMWDDHDCSDISFIIAIPVSQFYRQFCELYLKENLWLLFFINCTLFVYYR